MSIDHITRSTTEKIIDLLEASPNTIKTKPAQKIDTSSPTDILREKIYTELYKLDQDPDQQTLEKKHKNARVSRTLFEYLLSLPENKFLTFSHVRLGLLGLLRSDLSDYCKETIQHCYDRLIALQHAELYQPHEQEMPEYFSPMSELYQAQWPIDEKNTFTGTMEIIRNPVISLANCLPLTLSILHILDSISANSKKYIPIPLEELKTHILHVDYIVVFREAEPNKTSRVVGVTIGVNRFAPACSTFLCAPGIIRTKSDKNGLGTILGAMIAKGSLDFGKKELLIAGFTQNKRVMDFMKMCNPDLNKTFISGFHWPQLAHTEKETIDQIIRAYTGKTRTIEDTGYYLNQQGIAENRYTEGNKADTDPMPIKGLELKPADAVFMFNTVPKNIYTIMQAHTKQTRYKNRFFGEFVKALITIESFSRIR